MPDDVDVLQPDRRIMLGAESDEDVSKLQGGSLRGVEHAVRLVGSRALEGHFRE